MDELHRKVCSSASTYHRWRYHQWKLCTLCSMFEFDLRPCMRVQCEITWQIRDPQSFITGTDFTLSSNVVTTFISVHVSRNVASAPTAMLKIGVLILSRLLCVLRVCRPPCSRCCKNVLKIIELRHATIFYHRGGYRSSLLRWLFHTYIPEWCCQVLSSVSSAIRLYLMTGHWIPIVDVHTQAW